MKCGFVLTFLFASLILANANPLQQNSAGNDALPATTAASLTLSPTTLSFGVQLLKKASATKTVKLMNAGSTTLTAINITVTGNFSISSKTCGTSLATAATCTLYIAFKPAGIGNRYGAVNVSYSGGTGSPQSASLNGIGTELGLSTTSLNLGTQVLANKSTSQSVTLTNVGTTALTISALTVSGDFAVASNGCGSTVAAGASCPVSLTFTPSALGSRSGSLKISHNGGGSPTLVSLSATSIALPLRTDVLSNIAKANDYWIANDNPTAASNTWNVSTYFRGDMAAYQATGTASYLDLARTWANGHAWSLIGGDTTRFADNQAAGEVYIQLYQIDHNSTDITHINNDILAMVNSAGDTDWTWIDALNMAMPSFASLGVINNNSAYWSKMFDLYNFTKRVDGGPGLYQATDHLWFRDKTFLPPMVGPNGKNIYWSRGNGWVLAAHAKVLTSLPTTDPHYQEYLTTFQDMASALASRQRPDGFWNVDLGDPLDFPGPETSGTSFFVFGMAWGMNHNLLSRATYLPIVVKAWDGLVQTAVQPSGFLGYVQGQGSSPSSSQPVTATSTADFGVGAFLLAGAELAKLAAISQVVAYPSSLNFGSQAVGTTSVPRSVTITNQGTTPVTFTKIYTTGNFIIQTNTCATSLAAQASCKISILFQPSGTATRYGNLWLYDNGGASPQKVSLSGTGI